MVKIQVLFILQFLIFCRPVLRIIQFSCIIPAHAFVDLGHEGEHVRGGVEDHVPGERPTRPEALVAPVDALQLVLHGVDRRLVEFAQRVQADVLHLVHRLASLLQLQYRVRRLIPNTYTHTSNDEICVRCNNRCKAQRSLFYHISVCLFSVIAGSTPKVFEREG